MRERKDQNPSSRTSPKRYAFEKAGCGLSVMAYVPNGQMMNWNDLFLYVFAVIVIM